MSVSINIEHALKKYGNKTIIPDLSVKIKAGEFFTLLGPSGCGKTTLLRMIAGFNSIEGGHFFFDDKEINNIDPAKRQIGMVFQNYAVFPHLTVRKNVEYGLKTRKLSPSEIKTRTDEFLQLMQIEEYQDRLPERLSGGQQQRVALARALVICPDVLLMDEPLSNLDAKLRVEMRTAIKEIQNKIGITTVYVTHDQEEAMAVSDRIAVMNGGVIQQIGKPFELYQRPANLFVATFIGKTNVLKLNLTAKTKSKQLLEFDNGYSVEMKGLKPIEEKSIPVCVSIRPEEFVLSQNGNEGLDGTVEDSIFLGLNTHYFVRLDSGEKIDVIQESQINKIIAKGTSVKLTVKAEKINVFTQDGSSSLMKTDLED